MDKNNITSEKNKTYESLNLTNRKQLKLEGIVEVANSCETNINIKLRDTALNILGQNMHITKLDIQSGVLEVDGIIDSIKYGKTGNIFKRIFK